MNSHTLGVPATYRGFTLTPDQDLDEAQARNVQSQDAAWSQLEREYQRCLALIGGPAVQGCQMDWANYTVDDS